MDIAQLFRPTVIFFDRSKGKLCNLLRDLFAESIRSADEIFKEDDPERRISVHWTERAFMEIHTSSNSLSASEETKV